MGCKELGQSDRYWKTREEGIKDIAQVSGLGGHGTPHQDGAWEKEGHVCLENYGEGD